MSLKWRADELEIIQHYYGREGLRIRNRLRPRSDGSIRAMARTLKLYVLNDHWGEHASESARYRRRVESCPTPEEIEAMKLELRRARA